jgi:hypothetical protein
MDETKKLLLEHMQGEHAHDSFDEAVKDFPEKLINAKPANVPYSFWYMIEHMRIAQKDILDYAKGENYVELKWPEEYWPKKDATKKEWDKSVSDFKRDREELKKVLQDRDIFEPFKEDHNLLREFILTTQHTAYHIGEFIMARQIMGAWKTKLSYMQK